MEAGLLTVTGADGIGAYRCVMQAPVCSFSVVGTELDDADNVQVTCESYYARVKPFRGKRKIHF